MHSTLRFTAWVSCLVFALFLGTSPAFAQDGQSGNNDFSMFIGNMLPNQIDGVREILPVFGGRYALGSNIGALEGSFFNTHAGGVDFTTFSIGYRADIPLGQGLAGAIYGGFDWNWYIPEGDRERRSETGLHVGAAGLMHVADTLWLRTDLKFMGNPGTALYLLFGLMFKAPGGGGGQ
jgi:hypothetical protein